jgi:hypothetical protein
MRRGIIVALLFLLVIFMALTSLGLFGQDSADVVQVLIRG